MILVTHLQFSYKALAKAYAILHNIFGAIVQLGGTTDTLGPFSLYMGSLNLQGSHLNAHTSFCKHTLELLKFTFLKGVSFPG